MRFILIFGFTIASTLGQAQTTNEIDSRKAVAELIQLMQKYSFKGETPREGHVCETSFSYNKEEEVLRISVNFSDSGNRVLSLYFPVNIESYETYKVLDQSNGDIFNRAYFGPQSQDIHFLHADDAGVRLNFNNKGLKFSCELVI
jgi:hypothetical protein